MKASLKLREDQKQPTLNQPQNQTENNPKSQYQNPLLRAKIPISVLGFPFLSILTAGDSSDLSFGIRTNSINGPSLKFSYSPNISSTTQTPFSISLKSGVGFFGSPQNSPLIMSAQFNLFGNPNPSFFLQIKPQFGDFSLKKTAVSAPLTNPNPKTPSFTKENGEKNHFTDDIGVMLERPLVWKELTEFRNGGDGVFSGVEVRAKTLLPITKKAVVKCRWGVNFPPDFGQKQRMPFLTVDKIAVERVEEKVEVNSQKKKNKDGSEGDLEVLKGLCLWMRNEVEGLKRENRILKESVDELNLGGSTLKSRRGSGSASKNVVSSSSPSTPGFEQWRNKKNGGEEKNSSGSESSKDEVGEELKRAIMAAKGMAWLASFRAQLMSSCQKLPQCFLDASAKIRPLPGANRLIKHLTGHGVPMALASNSPYGKHRNKFTYPEGQEIYQPEGWSVPLLPPFRLCGILGWAGLLTRGVYKIGWNPYFNNTEKTIEPWLFHDFSEDFYWEELRLAIVGYMRPEVLTYCNTYAYVRTVIRSVHERKPFTEVFLNIMQQSNSKRNIKKKMCSCIFCTKETKYFCHFPCYYYPCGMNIVKYGSSIN